MNVAFDSEYHSVIIKYDYEFYLFRNPLQLFIQLRHFINIMKLAKLTPY